MQTMPISYKFYELNVRNDEDERVIRLKDSTFYINCHFSHATIYVLNDCFVRCMFHNCTLIFEGEGADFVKCGVYRCNIQNTPQDDYRPVLFENCTVWKCWWDEDSNVSIRYSENDFYKEICINDKPVKAYAGQKLVGMRFNAADKNNRLGVVYINDGDAVSCSFVDYTIVCRGEVNLVNCDFTRCKILADPYVKNNINISYAKFVETQWDEAIGLE